MPKVRLLVADDHQLVLEGLIGLLSSEPFFEVMGMASDGYEVLELAEKNSYDVCLLDINMPKLDGIATARLLKERRPGIKIIILTTYNDKEIISELVHIGVAGYLLKNSNKQELTEAIQKVMAGRYYFSEEIERIILQGVSEKQNKEVITLTEREQEIVMLLAKEYTNNRIANELHISYRTVETHRKNIMQKTKTHNLAGLMQFAYSKGFLK